MGLRFDRIVLHNFKAFWGRHTFKIDPPGLYYVTGTNLKEPALGANGAAKSTLFDALFWCWTGKTLSDNRPGSAVEPWNSKGTVRVSNYFFDDHGDEHTITRTRRPNSLKLDDKEIEQPVADRWLGMSSDNLRRTLILGQSGEENQLFLDLGPEDQSRMFTDMLDLNLWIAGAELANKKAAEHDRLVSQHERAETEANGRADALHEQLAEEREANRTFRQMKTKKIAAATAQFEETTRLLMEQERQKPKEVKSSVAKLEDELENFRSRLGPLRDKERKQRDKAQEINSRIAGHERVLAAYDEAKDDVCPECGQKVSGKHIRERIDFYTSEQQDLLEKLRPILLAADSDRELIDSVVAAIDLLERDIRAGRASAEKDREEYAKWEREVTKLRQTLQMDERDLQQIKAQENPHQKAIDSLLDRIEAVEKNRGLSKAAAEATGWMRDTYRYWAGAYKEIRLNLIDETLLEIEVAANRHAEAHGLTGWRIEFATEKTTKSDTVSRGMTALIWPPGIDDPIKWKSYSGGERKRWQLAVTFALSEVLLARAGLTFNMEALDEPTGALSDQGIDDLLIALRERAHDLGRTIYLIDQRMLDKGAFDGVIEIERDVDGTSRILT